MAGVPAEPAIADQPTPVAPFSQYTLLEKDVELAVEGYRTSREAAEAAEAPSAAAAARGGNVSFDAKTF